MKTALFRISGQIGCLAFVLALAGCGGIKSVVITPIKESDKKLKCSELVVEINEAMFFVDQAKRNRGWNLRHILWPIGYPATYLSAGQAIEAADSRVDYLKELYSINGCNRKKSRTISGRPARIYR